MYELNATAKEGRLLDALAVLLTEAERVQQYPEYLDHARILPAYQEQARFVTSQ